MDAGLSKRMTAVEVEVVGRHGSGITVLAPSVRGHEGGNETDFVAQGECCFLRDGLCDLHDRGLKPLEGRVSLHDRNVGAEVRRELEKRWESREGHSAVWRWDAETAM